MTPHVIKVRNVNDALREGANWLRVAGVRENSRNGVVLRAPGPVLTVYRYPQERVLFHPARHANPYFHLMESLWMLSGRQDVGFVAQFNRNMENFSDDGRTLNAAYGYRWMNTFGYDQIAKLIMHLKEFPQSRRAVLSMWDAIQDLHSNSKDLPCNTHVYFEITQSDNALDMTVCCRSNDMIWGAYGANAVHFSVLQEYMAAKLGVKVGQYAQFSNNFHLYLDVHGEMLKQLVVDDPSYYAYEELPVGEDYVTASPLVEVPDVWDQELHTFMPLPSLPTTYWINRFQEPFFAGTAVSMLLSWQAHKQNHKEAAVKLAYSIVATDWRKACVEWLERTYAKQEHKDV